MLKNRLWVKPFSWYIEKTELADLLQACELRVEKVENHPLLSTNPSMIESLASALFRTEIITSLHRFAALTFFNPAFTFTRVDG
jgi:hypothetical protein